jgi:ADP-ribosylarginine hydrolase
METQDKKSLKEKFYAIMFLHSVGDTIGFKNGEWEFNYLTNDVTYKTTLEIVFQFISLGGYSSINLDGWNVSDDTLFHYATANALLELNQDDININNNKINENFIKIYKKNLSSMLKKIEDDQKELEDKELTIENLSKYKFRGIGKKTMESIRNFESNITPSFILSGGNGCAMRSLCIGMIFHKPEDLDKLILTSVELGRLTHPSPIGYLGGFTSAYFVHLALNDVPIEKWPSLLIEIVDSKKISKFINNENYDEILAYRRFISLWKKYIELRFKNEKIIKTASHRNLIFRTKFFYDFKINYDVLNETDPNEKNYMSIVSSIGDSGVTAMLMAYDALIDAENSWEKLIYYAMLHVGDSDTVGAIAGGLFGAIYGINKTPLRMIENIEYYDQLRNITKQLYKKFGK